MSLKRHLAILTVATAGALSAGLAQANSDVRWSVSVGSPDLAVRVGSNRGYGVPVYPVYQPVVVDYRRPAPYYREYFREPTRWDRDADGIPDRYERNYRPPHHHHHDRWDRYDPRDRDNDGVPNRYDRRPDNPYRR